MKVAIVYPGDRAIREAATRENNRFAPLFAEFASLGVETEPVVYHPDYADQVRAQLEVVDAALVWVNPIQDGHDRTVLDALLRDVAASGVFVSTHPDAILKMGTKEVLYRTRSMGWGTDVQIYTSPDDLRDRLLPRLKSGEIRVLKQNRGHSGIGIWKVSLDSDGVARVRHAERGSLEQRIQIDEFLRQCEVYFAGGGKIIDQAYQPRLQEGMIRCYIVQGKVGGFGHQAVNALFPAPEGSQPEDAPQPGPRLYFPPDKPEFQALKHQLENVWLSEMQTLLDVPAAQLPVLWDADFLLGPQIEGRDTYVLCEINVSSVAPYPDSATPMIARKTIEIVSQRQTTTFRTP